METKFSLKKRFKSFSYAFKGMQLLIKYEHNAWIHTLATLVVVAGGFFFGISKTEWIVCILCIGCVFAAEAFNTAIEYTANYLTKEHVREIGIIKDIAAGGVLFVAIATFIIGLLIFAPYVIAMF